MSYLHPSAAPPTTPLTSLLAKIPTWQSQLSKLAESMDNRQQELAEAAVHYRPNPSLKRVGSCESLRPADDPGLGGLTEEGMDTGSDTIMGNGHTDMNGKENGTAAPAAAATAAPRLLRNSTSPGPVRTPSRRLAAAGISKREHPPVLRKRKTESPSLTSATSLALAQATKSTKQRTRSMIIVYYEGSVQTAFAEICKSISFEKNGIKRVRQARELGMKGGLGTFGRGLGGRAILDRQRAKARAALDTQNATGAANGDAEMMLEVDDEPLEADDLLPDLTADTTLDAAGTENMLEVDDTVALQPDADLPALQYRSTRRMNPNLATTALSRNLLSQSGISGSTSAAAKRLSTSSSLSKSSGKSEKGEKDVYEELDDGLEACYKLCEDAAHEFLKYGSCRVEIKKVERLLPKLKIVAERGLKEEPELELEAATGFGRNGVGRRYGFGRFGAGGAGDLGGLEVDDGLGELEADDNMDVLEADDGLGDLEADDGLLVADEAVLASLAKKLAGAGGAGPGAGKMDVDTTIPNGKTESPVAVDVGDLNMKSGEAAKAEEMAQIEIEKRNARERELLIKYRVQAEMNKEVREVHVTPLNRVS